MRIPIAIVEHFILSKGISIQHSGKNLKTKEHHSTNYVPKHDKIVEVVRYGYSLTKWKLIEEADSEAIRQNELNKLCNEILG